MQLDLLSPGRNRRRTPKEQVRVLRVHLHDEEGETATQWKIVDQAIRGAQEAAGTSCVGHAVSLICMHYLAMSAGKHDALNLLVPLERLLGVRIIVTDREVKNIKYGRLTLEALAEALSADQAADGSAGDESGEVRS